MSFAFSEITPEGHFLINANQCCCWGSRAPLVDKFKPYDVFIIMFLSMSFSMYKLVRPKLFQTCSKNFWNFWALKHWNKFWNFLTSYTQILTFYYIFSKQFFTKNANVSRLRGNGRHCLAKFDYSKCYTLNTLKMSFEYILK